MQDKTAGLARSTRRGYFFGLFDAADFVRARNDVTGLNNFASHEDFLDHVEGLQIGLASSGADAVVVPVSLDAFESWRKHYTLPASIACVDRFAGRVAVYRTVARDTVRASLRATPFSRDEVRRNRDDLLALVLQVDRVRYAEWLACLGGSASRSMADSYARLLLEQWCDA